MSRKSPSKAAKSDSYMDKIGFIDKLISMDKDQINQFIKENGKQPKLICPIIWTDYETEETK